MSQLKVISHNEQLVTDSRDVAEMTGKRHSDLIRDIENYKTVLDQNANLRSENFFIQSSYSAGTGRKYKCFLLTKKGCDMVANKMTGQKGVLFTAEYVTRFEEMELEINQPYKLPKNYKEALLQLVEKEEENEKLTTENKMYQQQISEYKPKVNYVDEILKSTDVMIVSQVAEDYGMTATQFNKLLKKYGIQYKLGGQWLLYSKYKGNGYTKSETTSFKHSDGRTGVNLLTKWTQKGRLFLYEFLKSKGILPTMEQMKMEFYLEQKEGVEIE